MKTDYQQLVDDIMAVYHSEFESVPMRPVEFLYHALTRSEFKWRFKQLGRESQFGFINAYNKAVQTWRS